MKPTEPFVIVALILLMFGLVTRFISPAGLGVSVTWHGTGYVLPPSFICIALATMLCFIASVYSLWMLPFNRAATRWHFFADDYWYRGVLAGILSSTQLTNGDMGRLRGSSSDSAHSSNFRLESHPSGAQTAAIAWVTKTGLSAR